MCWADRLTISRDLKSVIEETKKLTILNCWWRSKFKYLLKKFWNFSFLLPFVMNFFKTFCFNRKRPEFERLPNPCSIWFLDTQPIQILELATAFVYNTYFGGSPEFYFRMWCSIKRMFDDSKPDFWFVSFSETIQDWVRFYSISEKAKILSGKSEWNNLYIKILSSGKEFLSNNFPSISTNSTYFGHVPIPTGLFFSPSLQLMGQVFE